MSKSRFPKAPEQVAAHLRAELGRGRWTDEMPGRKEVAAELGGSPQTAQPALALLEREWLLASQGSGRPRRIEWQKVTASGRPLLREAILVAAAVVRRALRWADNVACGKKDSRQKVVSAEFFEGWTIGPVTAEKIQTRFTARP